MIKPIVKRWEAAIADVLRRADALLAQRSAESDALVAAQGPDFPALGRLWSRTEAEYRPFSEELQSAWDVILDELADLAVGHETTQSEGTKRDLAACELEIRHTRALRLVMARAAERLKRDADERGDATLHAAFEGSGARHLAERAGHEDWERMTRAHTRIKNFRDTKDVPIVLLKELESSARRYFTTLFTVEAELLPLQAPYVAAKIERHMKDIERTLRQHWQWRERGKT
jgi:hypothetical protein